MEHNRQNPVTNISETGITISVIFGAISRLLLWNFTVARLILDILSFWIAQGDSFTNDGAMPLFTLWGLSTSPTQFLSYNIRLPDMAILELVYSPLKNQFIILRTLATRIRPALAAHRTTSRTLVDDAYAIEIEISTQIVTHVSHDGGEWLA